MASKEFEQHLEKVALVKAELAKLEAAIKRSEHVAPVTVTEDDQKDAEEKALFLVEKSPDNKNTKKKNKGAALESGEVFENPHPHLDVSPGLHTVIDLEHAA